MTVTPVSVTSPGTTGDFTAYVNSDPATGTLQGALTETAPASDTASSGLNGRLQRIAQRLTSLIALWNAGAGTAAAALRTVPASDTTFAYSSSATFTPAASSHTAGDVVGGAQNFASLGPSGGAVMINTVTMEVDNSSAEATAWRLHLYNVTPSSAIADDGAWDYANADRSQYLGFVDLPSTATDIGSNQWVEVNNVGKVIRLSGTGIYGYLVNLTTLTPGAVAHVVRIHAISV